MVNPRDFLREQEWIDESEAALKGASHYDRQKFWKAEAIGFRARLERQPVGWKLVEDASGAVYRPYLKMIEVPLEEQEWRDLFAAHAVGGLAQRGVPQGEQEPYRAISFQAYHIAEQMLQRRAERLAKAK